VIPCWGDLDSSCVAARFQLHLGAPPESVPGLALPRETKSHETPQQRALRFQRMLDSGEVESRAALAREVGVGHNADNRGESPAVPQPPGGVELCRRGLSLSLPTGSAPGETSINRKGAGRDDPSDGLCSLHYFP
jgi:hypothetical protein